MGNLKKIIFCLFVCGMIVSCEVDYSGFVRATDRVEKRFVQSMAWNIANPQHNIICNTNNYSVIVASDLHIGGTVNTKALFNIYEGSNDIALILIGDIVSGRKEDYEVFKKISDSVTKPLLKIVGNHDLYFDGWKTYYEIFGSSTYYFTISTPDSTDLYICLDSGGGTLGKSQMDWLSDLLQTQRNQYRHCIVLGHVNMLRTRHTTSANPLIEENAHLISLFTENKVELVINGHDHHQNKTVFGNTSYIITDALMDNYKNAGYVKLSVIDSNLDTEFLRFD